MVLRGARAGVAFFAADAGARVGAVVKVDVPGQGLHAHPAQGFTVVDGGVGVGGGVQGQQARIVGEDVAVQSMQLAAEGIPARAPLSAPGWQARQGMAARWAAVWVSWLKGSGWAGS